MAVLQYTSLQTHIRGRVARRNHKMKDQIDAARRGTVLVRRMSVQEEITARVKICMQYGERAAKELPSSPPARAAVTEVMLQLDTRGWPCATPFSDLSSMMTSHHVRITHVSCRSRVARFSHAHDASAPCARPLTVRVQTVHVSVMTCVEGRVM